MNINIIIENNPFIISSASANRWLALIEGISKFGVKLELFIYGGYNNKKEATDWKLAGNKNGIAYKYIDPQLIEGYWKKSYYNYIGDTFREGHLIKLFRINSERDKKP
jgi:hypothetical protein